MKEPLKNMGASVRARLLLQVCESLAEPKTRSREISALSEGMSEVGGTIGTIVSRHEEERIETDNGIINVVPAWRFLLDMPD